MKNYSIGLIVLCFVAFWSCTKEEQYFPLSAEESEQYSGGEATVFNKSE